MSSVDSNRQSEEQGQTEVDAILRFLKRPQDAPYSWPCLCFAKLKDGLTPPNPHAGKIPVNSLQTDIRIFATDAKCSDRSNGFTPFERSEHFAFYTGSSQVEAMTDFWKSALHRILCCDAQCPRLKTRNGLTMLILDNLFGIHASDNETSGTAPATSRKDAAEIPSGAHDGPDQRLWILLKVFG